MSSAQRLVSIKMKEKEKKRKEEEEEAAAAVAASCYGFGPDPVSLGVVLKLSPWKFYMAPNTLCAKILEMASLLFFSTMFPENGKGVSMVTRGRWPAEMEGRRVGSELALRCQPVSGPLLDGCHGEPANPTY